MNFFIELDKSFKILFSQQQSIRSMFKIDFKINIDRHVLLRLLFIYGISMNDKLTISPSLSKS